MARSKWINILLGGVFSLLVCTLCIGYAAISDELVIDGVISATPQEGIFIYDVLDESGNRVEYLYDGTYLRFKNTTLAAGAHTFTIKVMNRDENYSYYYDDAYPVADKGLTVNETIEKYTTVFEAPTGNNRTEFKATVNVAADVAFGETDNFIHFNFVKRVAVLASSNSWFINSASAAQGITNTSRKDITAIEIKTTDQEITYSGGQIQYGGTSVAATKAWKAGKDDSHNVWAYISGSKLTIIGGDTEGNFFADDLKATFSYMPNDSVVSDLHDGGKNGNDAQRNNFFRNVTSITGLGNLKINNVKSMFAMFWGCLSLQKFDDGFANLDTSGVTEFVGVFAYCTKLQNLNITGWNTSRADSFSSMFYYCESLASLDVSHFDTSNATNFNTMFRYCHNLTTLDLRNFDTRNYTTANNMFGFATWAEMQEGLTVRRNTAIWTIPAFDYVTYTN